MPNISGGQLAAEALIAREVQYVFTLSGGHITPIYQYLEKSPVTLFDTRHEQAAVFMAEAYGRLTRRPGVAMVTAGPGFTNALTGVASAHFANTPLVLISGCVGLDCREKLDLQDMPQAPVIAPMVKKALVCQKTERIPEYIDLAFRTAQGGRPGPVYLELPVDILNGTVEATQAVHRKTEVHSHPADLDQAADLLEMIRRAQKPLLIAGSGVWYSGAEAALTQFVEKTGVPVFTAALGRGTIPDRHPLCFESSLAIRPGAGFQAYMNTDLVILLGNRISLFYIFGDLFNRQAKIVQADIEAEELGRNRSLDLAITSDVKALLTAANIYLRRQEDAAGLPDRFSGWVDELRQAAADSRTLAQPNWESAAIPIHPLRLAREVDAFMDREDDLVVADGGDTTTWMGMTRTINRPGRYLDYGIFGCLAVGLPFANAAKLLNPDNRVCLVTGDGSVGFNFMEFETAIRKGLPIVVVINNDLGWGMIRHSQEIKIGRAIPEGTYLGRVDYHKMVEALGGAGYLVEKPEEIRPALEAAFASGQTACINVMTDPTVISPGSMALANLGGYKAF
jgi:acetolactate synthase I/II/III large subunit